jgi:hypothetical protein
VGRGNGSFKEMTQAISILVPDFWQNMHFGTVAAQPSPNHYSEGRRRRSRIMSAFTMFHVS